MSFARDRRAAFRRRARRLVVCLVLAAIAWAAGFVVFAYRIPDRVTSPATVTDAIVVLTGGSLRLQTGLQLLSARKAKKLFVSGVHRGVDVRELLRIAQHSPEAVECCIALGYDADDTRGNAAETAAWLKNQKYRSLRLVTASYHMPRSMAEFRAVLPGMEIAAHPVFPKSFKGKTWYLWPGSAALLLNEYNKYLLSTVRRMVIDPLLAH